MKPVEGTEIRRERKELRKRQYNLKVTHFDRKQTILMISRKKIRGGKRIAWETNGKGMYRDGTAGGR